MGEKSLAEHRNKLETVEGKARMYEARMKAAEEENEHLKVAVEELQMKLKRFMNKAEESGNQIVRRLIEDEDFSKILNSKSVWDRLYDDALQRIETLKKKRARFTEKHG